MESLWSYELSKYNQWSPRTLNSEPMSDPAPSDKFLFFQPSRVFERLMIPGFWILAIGWLLYNSHGLTYALFLSPRSYWLAVVAAILATSAITLISVNAHWAYEGNFTRWQTRPFKKYNAGSRWWCAARHGSIFLLCVFFLIGHFTRGLPHVLLLYTGSSEVSELVVQEKKDGSISKYKRFCSHLYMTSSAEYRSGNLCLESEQLYAEINVGDTLIVEGKANWIGLLVNRLIAVRDGDSGPERSVGMMPRHQPVLVRLDGERLIPKTWQFR